MMTVRAYLVAWRVFVSARLFLSVLSSIFLSWSDPAVSDSEDEGLDGDDGDEDAMVPEVEGKPKGAPKRRNGPSRRQPKLVPAAATAGPLPARALTRLPPTPGGKRKSGSDNDKDHKRLKRRGAV